MKILKAVIFDMDGVIVDSERLWEKAEKEIFSALGVIVTDEYAGLTKSMTTSEVTKFWFDKFPWPDKDLDVVEQMVVSRVIELLGTEDCLIHGVKEFIKKLRAKDYKIGLATNSPTRIISTVLQKLNLADLFDTVCSSEFENNGKPDPAIYLTTARKLNIEANKCIAIEDSYSGMLAAKKAGMKVVAFTNGNTHIDFEIADYKFDNFDLRNIEKLN
jgi:sugar-phosphatase